MNIFEKASKVGYRYQTVRGLVTTEDLWDIPLSSRSGFCLDSIAIAIDKKINETKSTSFVTANSNADPDDEVKLEILKHVIKTKQEESEAKRNRMKRAQQRQKLLEIKANKEDSKLNELDIAEIDKLIAELEE
jgi:hypothetical protein